MTSAPSVSVVVAVYNGEQFLEECLGSLSRQRLDDMELIIVDDGSTDATGRICKEFVAAEPRARLLQKANAGVSAARNSGLELARGKYIVFVDADDWVTEDGLSHLLGEAERCGADIVIGNYLVVDGDQQIRNAAPEVATAEQLLCAALSGKCHSAFWNKLVRRDLLEEERFPEGVGYLEDSVLLCRILAGSTVKVSTVKDVVYAYRQHASAVTAGGGPKLFDMLQAHRLIATALQEKAVGPLVMAALGDRIYRGTWVLLTMIHSDHLAEAVSRAKVHLQESRRQRGPAPHGVRPAVLRLLLSLPQPLAVAGIGALRRVLGRLSPARRRLAAQNGPTLNGAS